MNMESKIEKIMTRYDLDYDSAKTFYKIVFEEQKLDKEIEERFFKDEFNDFEYRELSVDKLMTTFNVPYFEACLFLGSSMKKEEAYKANLKCYLYKYQYLKINKK